MLSFLHFIFLFHYSRDVAYGLGDIDWDSLGFALTPTDYMYVMKCSQGQNFGKGELQHFGNIELSPSAGVLNYGQVCPLYLYTVLIFLDDVGK